MKAINSFLFLFLLMSAVVYGQQKKDSETISINPNARNTQVIIRHAREDDQSAETEEGDEETPKTPLKKELERWTRPAVGFWLSLQNSTVVKSQLHISSDDVLLGQGREFGFGLGGQIDFPMPGSDGANAIRLRLGVDKIAITPNDEVLAKYSTLQLEKSATVFTLTGYYRMAPDMDLDMGTFWWAPVAQLNHAFSTQWPQQGQSGVSKVRSSYGFNFGVAVGLEVPISELNDIGVAADWYPLTGFSAQVSLRTSL